MFINIANNYLELKYHSSEEELLLALTSCNLGKVLIESEEAEEFISIQISRRDRFDSRFGIGIYNEEKGIGLEILPIPDKELVILGVNKNILGFELKTLSPSFAFETFTRFAGFYLLDENNLLVRDEIGFIKLDLFGNKKWEFYHDLVQDFQVMDKTLWVTTMENETFKLSLETGLPF